jgi:hypothetical protein
MVEKLYKYLPLKFVGYSFCLRFRDVFSVSKLRTVLPVTLTSNNSAEIPTSSGPCFDKSYFIKSNLFCTKMKTVGLCSTSIESIRAKLLLLLLLFSYGYNFEFSTLRISYMDACSTSVSIPLKTA